MTSLPFLYCCHVGDVIIITEFEVRNHSALFSFERVIVQGAEDAKHQHQTRFNKKKSIHSDSLYCIVLYCILRQFVLYCIVLNADPTTARAVIGRVVDAARLDMLSEEVAA